MKKFIAILGLFISVSVIAAEQCTSWGCVSTISKLYTTTDGPVYIGTPLNEKLANCTPVSGVYFTLNTSSKNAKEIYSSLLAAFMSGKRIALRIKEGSSNCELAYVTLDPSH